MRLTPEFQRLPLARGVRLHVLTTDQFPFAVVLVHLLRPLDRATTAAAVLAQVLLRGTRRRPRTLDLRRSLERLRGSALEAAVLKLGGFQALRFRLEVPDGRWLGERDLLPEAVALLGEVLFDPARTGADLHEGHVRQELEHHRQLLESRVLDREGYAGERLIEHLCRGEPYGRSEAGALDELAPLTRSALAALHERLLARAPVEAFLVSSLTARQAAALFRRALPFRGRRPASRARTGLCRGARARPARVRERLPGEQAQLGIGFRTGIGPRARGFFPLVMAQAVLAGGPYGRLFKRLREDEGLVYDVHADHHHLNGLVAVQAGCAVRAAEVRDLARRGPASEEWRRAAADLQVRLEGVWDTPDLRASLALEASLAGRPGTIGWIARQLAAVEPAEARGAFARFRRDLEYRLLPGRP
jgi:predicted Zn-dependent peptidase